MMEDVPLYNSTILATYMDLLKEKYPHVNVEKLLEYAEISPYELEDRGHWLTQKQIDRFHDFLMRNTENPQIAREAGRFVVKSKSSSLLRQYTAGFVTPSMAYWMMGKISSSLSRHLTFKINHIAANKVEMIVTPQEGVKEKPYQCENRIGLFEGLVKLFTNKYPTIEHNECLHKGDSSCKYIIFWKITPAMIWKLIAGYSSVLSIVASLILLFFVPFHSWLTYSLDLALISVIGYLIAEKMASRALSTSLESQQSIGDQLMEQFDIRYNELALIKEIGEAASSILDPQLLLNFIVDSLQKRLQFKRSMIMLTNPEKTKLIYTTGYGYTPEEETLLKNTDFSLNNPQSTGIFYLTYRDQKPFLVNDIADIKNNLSEKSMKFMEALGVSAFTCIPIIYEGKSEGIFAVDGTKLKRPLIQSDLSLLMGIARQIGISLNNAIAHKKLKENEERFRNLSNNLPDIIYQIDQEGRFKYINPAWKEIFGHNKNELWGKNITEFIHENDRADFVHIFQKIITGKSTIRDKIFTILDKKGIPRYVTFTGTPDLDAEGKIMGITGTLKDITKLRNMETQLLQASKMEAVGTLTGGIAHDFNNIIQAIMGYNQLMLLEKQNDLTRKLYSNNIEELSQRAIQLVRQLLLFSRKVEPLSKIININSEIKSMHNLLVKSIPRMIDIKTNLSEDIYPINADSTQIGQVIMNLVINARDAIGDSGSIIITTKNSFLPEDTYINGFNIPTGNYTKLSVSDTGCGMEKKVIQHIFEPFFTTKEAGKGTGLGLAVVYGVVKSHNGFIYCESELEKGTTFHILFPALADARHKEVIETQQTRQLPMGIETILLVDDERSLLEIGRDTLISYGYKILTADNGEQAIEIYQAEQEKIQLVTLDLIMPGRGGKKCLADLISINPQVKVLMTSGYSSSQQIEELMKIGAAGFISKPYHPEDLLLTIRKIIDTNSSVSTGPGAFTKQ
jgi:PAS domain S-box-containing protein